MRMKWIYFLLVAIPAMAGRMGPGVPLPGWDWERANPSRPSPWTSEIAGYYYINDLTGTDSGRTYGHPGAPRTTIPATLPAGSYVEVASTYANQSGGVCFVKTTGTTNAWSANSDGPVFITTCPTNQAVFTVPCIWNGTNGFADHLHFANTTGNSLRFGSGSTLLRTWQMVVRHCLVMGDGVNDHSGFATAGLDETERANNVVFYGNMVTNITIMDSPDDLDRMAFSTSAYASNVWVFSNRWSRADGSRAGASDVGINPEFTRNVYFSSNYVWNMRQQGMAIKYGLNCLFAWNTITDVVSSAASPGKCIGGQYNPTNWWTVGNNLSGARYPIFMGSGDSGSRPIYHIGNIITLSRMEDPEEPHGGGTSDETGMQFNAGYVMHIYFNTFYDCVAGLGHDVAGGNPIYIENNIFYPNYASGAFILRFASAASNPVIRNNVIYDDSTFRVIIGGTTYTTLSSMENGTTRTGNIHANPLFVNASTHDFHLQSSSPAIRTGLTTNQMQVDIFARYAECFGEAAANEVRFHFGHDGLIDIGALEFISIPNFNAVPAAGKLSIVPSVGL